MGFHSMRDSDLWPLWRFRLSMTFSFLLLDCCWRNSNDGHSARKERYVSYCERDHEASPPPALQPLSTQWQDRRWRIAHFNWLSTSQRGPMNKQKHHKYITINSLGQLYQTESKNICFLGIPIIVLNTAKASSKWVLSLVAHWFFFHGTFHLL